MICVRKLKIQLAKNPNSSSREKKAGAEDRGKSKR